MGKQTIESKIRGALRAAISGHEDGTVVVSAADIAERTSLTVEQVDRFGRSKRGHNQIDFRRVGYSCGDFTVQPSPPPCEPIPPPAPQPDWFAPPVGDVIRGGPWSWRTGESRSLVRQVCGQLHAGKYVLPPWQRGDVWTESQSVALLESFMRGIPIGAITIWEPEHDDTTESSAFEGCPIGDHPAFVIDGQQRLTTVLRAARGDLDHWRWNGVEWTRGPGFLVPSQMVGRLKHSWGFRGWPEWVFSNSEKDITAMCGELDKLECFAITFMSVSGPVGHMVEVYRRLATFGSPHSVEDLAHMDRWLASR